MKRKCLHGRGDLLERDLAELEKFEDLLWGVKAGKTQDEAHRDVYGEVVFWPASTAGRTDKHIAPAVILCYKQNMTSQFVQALVAVGVSLLGGCAAGWGYDYDLTKEQAVSVAKPFFGPNDWTVPKIFEKPQSQLDCIRETNQHVTAGTGDGWWHNASNGGWCVHGASYSPSFFEGPAWIELAPRSTWSETALCHEMGHASRFMRGLDGDPDHKTAIFQPGGAEDQCQVALVAWEAQKML